MKTRNLMVVLAVLLVPTTLVLAASWTWVGGGLTHNWNTSGNWSGTGWACANYPTCIQDDVSIDVSDDYVTLVDDEETIDDLVLTDTFTFQGDTGNDYLRVLNVDRLDIVGPATITIDDEAALRAVYP